MTRTIITLEDSDKRWLDRYSGRHQQSTAQTIRLAIKEFQKKNRAESYHRAVADTAGILKDVLKEDSVKIVRDLRKEWD